MSFNNFELLMSYIYGTKLNLINILAVFELCEQEFLELMSELKNVKKGDNNFESGNMLRKWYEIYNPESLLLKKVAILFDSIWKLGIIYSHSALVDGITKFIVKILNIQLNAKIWCVAMDGTIIN
jgi:hypothetical protein